LQNLEKLDLGFKTENVIRFGVRPPRFFDDERKLAVSRQLIETLTRVPGMKAVGANRSRRRPAGRGTAR